MDMKILQWQDLTSQILIFYLSDKPIVPGFEKICIQQLSMSDPSDCRVIMAADRPMQFLIQ